MRSYIQSTLQLKWLLVILLLFISIQQGNGQGEVPELKTDRPDQTESSTVVPKGALQLEAGYFFQKATEESQSVKTHAYPTALVRVGVLEWLELRVLGALKDSVVENGSRRKVGGVSPLNLGLKFQLWQGQGWRPEAAFLVRAALPVGSRAFRPDDPEPELRLMLSNKITQKVEVAYNLTMSWPDGDPTKGYTLSLSGEVHDKVTVYGEVFGNKTEGEKAAHQADAGVLFLLRPNLQLDLAAGTGISKAAPDYFITAGLSLRLPR
jgi:hypothetical protein